MQFTPPLIEGLLIKRYKRFLADVRLIDGTVITAHTANTGAMTGCAEPGSRVWLSLSDNPKRKYAHTWEIVEVGSGVLVGINTMRSNHLVEEAIKAGTINVLPGYKSIRREVCFPDSKSRVDLLLEDDGGCCYVEVKNVTLVEGRVAYFPDTVSVRATQHLEKLQQRVAVGDRAALIYCIQRGDVDSVRPAEDIDPNYAQAVREAQAAGVQFLACRAQISSSEITLTTLLPVISE